jgi:hypothetical protein
MKSHITKKLFSIKTALIILIYSVLYAVLYWYFQKNTEPQSIGMCITFSIFSHVFIMFVVFVLYSGIDLIEDKIFKIRKSTSTLLIDIFVVTILTFIFYDSYNFFKLFL